MIQSKLFPSTASNSQGRHIPMKQNQTPARRIPPRKRMLRPNLDISNKSYDSNLQDIKSVFNFHLKIYLEEFLDSENYIPKNK